MTSDDGAVSDASGSTTKSFANASGSEASTTVITSDATGEPTPHTTPRAFDSNGAGRQSPRTDLGSTKRSESVTVERIIDDIKHVEQRRKNLRRVRSLQLGKAKPVPARRVAQTHRPSVDSGKGGSSTWRAVDWTDRSKSDPFYQVRTEDSRHEPSRGERRPRSAFRTASFDMLSPPVPASPSRSSPMLSRSPGSGGSSSKSPMERNLSEKTLRLRSPGVAVTNVPGGSLQRDGSLTSALRSTATLERTESGIRAAHDSGASAVETDRMEEEQ